VGSAADPGFNFVVAFGGELLMLGIEVAQSTVARYMSSGRGHLPRVGRHSCAIMPPGSRQTICSWFVLSPSSCDG
jgi:hypothetical protein